MLLPHASAGACTVPVPLLMYIPSTKCWLLRRMQDQTQTDLINLRRTIYLTIMSSAQFEEAGHKLMKIKLAQGQEIEVVTMLIECCSQEKTYIR